MSATTNMLINEVIARHPQKLDQLAALQQLADQLKSDRRFVEAAMVREVIILRAAIK